jgi:hypothetical protein
MAAWLLQMKESFPSEPPLLSCSVDQQTGGNLMKVKFALSFLALSSLAMVPRLSLAAQEEQKRAIRLVR